MKIRKLQRVAVAVACVGMVAPQSALAVQHEARTAPRAAVEDQPVEPAGIDVALAQGGLFVGQVVDAHGVAQPEAEVSVIYHGEQVVATKTDENGMFAARGLRGGQYSVRVMGGQVPCRLWADHTAPPAARPAALIVSSSDAVNGQYGGLGAPGGIVGWMQSHPMIVAGAVVTAVAVPVAVVNNDDDPTS